MNVRICVCMCVWCACMFYTLVTNLFFLAVMCNLFDKCVYIIYTHTSFAVYFSCYIDGMLYGNFLLQDNKVLNVRID